ncbi:hypothetical protein EXIGLDRAFT_729061 [Exidia glandulosa HHB12029]|uniref:Uncharacterized protein n=1 Tax=Exidia glandulosa HHB12029 TaxID=1314781 RepID=A0A165ZID8_EXIGL|nr:hypothetical protein EXIGLDRAFT_729061 [Exidia glandulosa HHB12029]
MTINVSFASPTSLAILLVCAVMLAVAGGFWYKRRALSARKMEPTKPDLERQVEMKTGGASHPSASLSPAAARSSMDSDITVVETSARRQAETAA